ncbi:fungal specific transcription factor domain-containing protein [Histoplasma ohiense]|nr:fungal specific transcription factor domain-containing protein [Histoplasma ohiense (nom. inval.)]
MNPDDCDVRPLYNGDFYESTADGPIFISYVELASLLGDLTQCCCRKYLSRQKRQYIEGALYRWTRELPDHLQLFWRASPNQGTSPKLVASAGDVQLRSPSVTRSVFCNSGHSFSNDTTCKHTLSGSGARVILRCGNF